MDLMKTNCFIALLALTGALAGRAAEDILIADFEGDTYGSWQVTGEAFGLGPAHANTASMKNKVSGYQGKGLVNSYFTSDKPIGTLTSPPFTIERSCINFLIGGGKRAKETCIDLLVDGKTVRTTVGLAVKDGAGFEVMIWNSWDVSEFAGKQAQIRIVDNYSGGWGHINVDQIVQSDKALTQDAPLPTASFKASLKEVPSYASKVPYYTFAATLKEQQEQLKKNPLLLRFEASRQQMVNETLRPVYHFISPESWLNDPNGLCFWQGHWHLFYQAYPTEDRRQHWGHAISEDLIHWRDLPLAIYPDPEKACFSGACYVEKDRVIAMYHGTEVGSMVAVSSDPLLLNWEKLTGKSVIPFPKPGEPKPPYNIFDPFVWKKGDYYYALTAGKLPDGPAGQLVRAEFLHRSKDLISWEYLHPFLENDRYGMIGDDGACPYFWPIGNKGKYILLHFSHQSGGKYMLGDYDQKRDKFVVTDGGNFNHGSVRPAGVHAPSAYPDGKGGVIAIFNMNQQKISNLWNGIMTLPRRLTLTDDDKLYIEPAGDYQSLRNNQQSVKEIKLPANQEVVLEKVAGNALEIIAEIDFGQSPMTELNVLRSSDGQEVTRIQIYHKGGYRITDGLRPMYDNSALTIDTARSSVLPSIKPRVPETAQFPFKEGKAIKLHVFIDKSVVEVFVDGQCAAVRVYPGLKDSIGVSLRAQGGDSVLKSLDAWQMKTIY